MKEDEKKDMTIEKRNGRKERYKAIKLGEEGKSTKFARKNSEGIALDPHANHHRNHIDKRHHNSHRGKWIDNGHILPKEKKEFNVPYEGGLTINSDELPEDCFLVPKGWPPPDKITETPISSGSVELKVSGSASGTTLTSGSTSIQAWRF